MPAVTHQITPKETEMTTLRTLALATALVTTSLFQVGCGTEEYDENSLPEVTEADEKADTTGATFVWVRPGAFTIQCFRDPCSTIMASEVNGAKQQLIYAIDYRALKLSAAQKKNAEDNRGKSFLYGKYTKTTVRGEAVSVLQVTRGNMAASERTSDTPTKDIYFGGKTSATVCVTDPCTTIDVQQLNSTTTASTTWSKLDLSKLGVSTSAESAIQSEFRANTAYVSVTGAITGGVAKISQVFRDFKAAPLPVK
jgi:hypothetical protein